MITLQDLDEAIVECLGKRNPDANTCIMLAAFYTIKQNLYPPIESQKTGGDPPPNMSGYSYSSVPTISYSGDSDFAQIISGKNQQEVMPIMDELMETLKVINPRLYSGVMRRFD